MESIIIIYKSRTGFTKRYAMWITEKIACQTVPFNQINNIDMNNYDIIIYGAGICGGRISGLKKFKQKAFNLSGKKIIVYASGAAPYTEEIVSEIKEENFTAKELDEIEFFYFQSGLSYERMGLKEKILMKSYSKILELRKNKSDIDAGTSEALAKSYDYSSREQIKPVGDYLQKLISESAV